VVLAGGRTGRDGIHGATFSSDVLDTSAGPELGSVVQIGDPIVEKRFADALPHVRDLRLYTAITDCGAGGLSSAVGELASELGAEVELADVPLKYPGLRPWEIWLSEAQERMVLAVPPEHVDRLQSILAAEGVEATVIGRFSGTGRLLVRYRGEAVADIDCHFLHRGMPTRSLKSYAPSRSADRASSGPASFASRVDLPPPTADFSGLLEQLLAHPTVASKESIVRRYDHEVQGRTVGKPFVGSCLDGPADAAVLRPLPRSKRGVAIGCGINPRYGMLDPYGMALLAIDEALRNVVAVGADPDYTALLDNFCWGNPNLPDRLAGLVDAAKGCYDGAVGFRVPFISGKDSLNNEYRDQEMTLPIPGTLLITALGLVPDLGRAVSMDLKQPGNHLYVLGLTANELGGSLLLQLQDQLGVRPPTVRPRQARSWFRALHRAIRAGLIQACHDLSEGGLAVAAAEMAIAGRLGLSLDLRQVPVRAPIEHPASLLFSESPSRFLVEVAPSDVAPFERILGSTPCAPIGTVLADASVNVTGLDGHPVLSSHLDRLLSAWQRPLQETTP
jgi:phosphoribosylformylglycinamidine synthase